MYLTYEFSTVLDVLMPIFKNILFSSILLTFLKFYYFCLKIVSFSWDIVSSSTKLSNLILVVKEINVNMLNESVKTLCAFVRRMFHLH